MLNNDFVSLTDLEIIDQEKINVLISALEDLGVGYGLAHEKISISFQQDLGNETNFFHSPDVMHMANPMLRNFGEEAAHSSSSVNLRELIECEGYIIVERNGQRIKIWVPDR